jgi:hypothetical protein
VPKITRKRKPERARAAKPLSSARPAPRPKPSAAPPPSTDVAAHTQRFVNDLLIRGDAAKRDSTGKLPLEATHAIERQNPDGSVVVKRVRFKTY